MEKIVKDMKITVADSGAVGIAVLGENTFLSDGCPFELAIDGSTLSHHATLKEQREEENALRLTYAFPYGMEATARIKMIPGTSVVEQTVTVVNRGEEMHVLTAVTSASLHAVGADGKKTWYDPEKYLLRYATSAWTKEGQWRAVTPEQMGVIPGCHHPWERARAFLYSCGSYSTVRMYPFFVLEEKEHGRVYFMEHLGAGNWSFELFHLGGYAKNGISMSVSGATEENGWHTTLFPGESYTTTPAVYGCTNGGLEEAVREMLIYRRATTAYGYAGREIPLVFNDYMNCLWGQPSDKALLPLIKAAGEAGAEYFCIDAGWHRNEADHSLGHKGDWIVADERFGEGGLAAIFAAIKAAGMKPGVWFEWESLQDTAKAFHLSPDCLLTRHGKPIVRKESGCYLFNMRSPAVRAHLHARVDALYAMGVRYIKNDYNFDTGTGTDMYGTSLAEGTRLCQEALYSFVEELKEKYPDLVIENCGGGALREDHGTLRHFDLQSTSDQEYYENYPSVLSGTLCYVAPEKAGIWAYPHPICFDKFFDPNGLPADLYDGMADGENTIFNMVNGMCGAMYLSGHIEAMDEANRALLHEGVETYKSIRRTIAGATPVFPLPHLLLNRDGFAAQGLLSENGEELLLAVWRVRAEGDTVRIPLGKYAKGFAAEMLYPADPHGASFSYDGETLTVTLPHPISGRYFRLKK